MLARAYAESLAYHTEETYLCIILINVILMMDVKLEISKSMQFSYLGAERRSRGGREHIIIWYNNS